MICSSPIITGITSCAARETHRTPIRESYLHFLPEPFFFTGTPGQPTRLVGDVLHLDAPDTYEHLPAKLWTLYEFLLNHLEFDYFLRFDDDTVPHLSRLYATLLSLYSSPKNSRPDYIGGNLIDIERGTAGSLTHHFGKTSDLSSEKPYGRPFKNSYLSGGLGVLLSRRAIEYIVENHHDEFFDPEELYEDKLHGDVLAQHGIKPVPIGEQIGTTDVSPHRIPLEDFLRNGVERSAPEFSTTSNRCICETPTNSLGTSNSSKIPRRIFAAWMGTNPITPARRRHLDSLRDNAGVDVVLVSPDNLSDYTLPGQPIHPAYQYLSETHKADYLRCYLMHHHGGGYADIKIWKHPWLPWFEALDSEPTKLAAGYPCEGPHWTANEELKPHWQHLIGNSGFIFRPNTQLTSEWFAAETQALESLLTSHSLAENPATFPQDHAGTDSTYPVPWAALGGMIMDPLIYKYRTRILPVMHFDPQSPDDYR